MRKQFYLNAICHKILVLFRANYQVNGQKKQNETDKEKTTKVDRTYFSAPFSPFGSLIAKTHDKSEEDWPKLITPPEDNYSY